MTLFFILTYLAQVLMTIQIAALAGTQGTPVPAPIVRSLIGICCAVAIGGAASLLSWAFYDDYRRYEDAFEWGITLLILAHPLVIYFAWRDSGFRARFTVSWASGPERTAATCTPLRGRGLWPWRAVALIER